MSVQTFLEDPWKQTHPWYVESVLHMRPAPEFATAEVIVASLYRACGFGDVSEGSVPAGGRELERRTQKPTVYAAWRSDVSADTWNALTHGVLDSPKQPNQSAKRFLQLSPVVPDVALYSGSARLSGNSWNPGALVARLIGLGSRTPTEAASHWRRLFDALGVGATDDIWARWLDGEFVRRRDTAIRWAHVPLEAAPDFSEEEKGYLSYPAQQFVRDLSSVVSAKDSMTRRQWTSLLEAILRIGTVSHVLWLCEANARLWKLLRGIVQGQPAPEAAGIRDQVLTCRTPFLKYGNPAGPSIRDYASRYLVARLGINLALWHLGDDVAHAASKGEAHHIAELLRAAERKRDYLKRGQLLEQVTGLCESQTKTIACKRGVGSNIVEFVRYALGQRMTADDNLRGYDQGYFLKKRGTHSSAPWVVSLGPVAVLALVHCCLQGAVGPRSVQRLTQHLSQYGLDVDHDEIDRIELGRQLRMLGLVLDSPDAETGMLLVPPFSTNGSSSEASS